MVHPHPRDYLLDIHCKEAVKAIPMETDNGPIYLIKTIRT